MDDAVRARGVTRGATREGKKTSRARSRRRVDRTRERASRCVGRGDARTRAGGIRGEGLGCALED